MSESDENSKKEKLRAAIRERVNKEEHAYRLVEKMVLLDSVDKEFFLNAGKYITISQYKDVTEERAITKLCGFALCNNRITQVLKQKYKISVKEKKVYDLTERKNFCSNKCYKASKYFESQLSSEPVWMREKNKSPGLTLFEDGEERMQGFTGSGEEVLISGEEFITSQGKDDKYEHVQTKHELAEDENGHSDNENVQVDYEHENQNYEHENQNYEYENHNYQHEKLNHQHENLDDEHEDVCNEHEDYDDDSEDNNERERFDSNHEYHNIHKHIQFDNNDLGCIVERIGNVKIDLDFTDSDDDDDDVTDDDIDNIDDDLCVKSEEKIGNRRDKIDHDVKSFAMIENISGDQEQPQKDNSEQEQIKKQCIEKVHEVLQEWCGIETKNYLRKSFRSWEIELLPGQKHSGEVVKDRSRGTEGRKSVILPSIDSKSQMAIRGKIVSNKLTKAMSPMLSKLSLTKADASSQLTNMLKTFRFTNTNIVLKPPEWTLVALTLLLVLVKFDLSLTKLLSSRQKDLHLLLSNTIDDEDDIDRLLDVFNFEGGSESAVLDGQQQFDMEELD